MHLKRHPEGWFQQGDSDHGCVLAKKAMDFVVLRIFAREAIIWGEPDSFSFPTNLKSPLYFQVKNLTSPERKRRDLAEVIHGWNLMTLTLF